MPRKRGRQKRRSSGAKLSIFGRTCRTAAFRRISGRDSRKRLNMPDRRCGPKSIRSFARTSEEMRPYRFDSLLPAIWKSTSSAADAARWVAELSSAAAEPAQFLAAIVNEEIVGPDERELLYARLLELAQQDAERRAGDARNDARWRFQDYQLRYLRSLLANRQFDKAGEAIRAIPEDLQASMHGSLIPIQIEVAAAKGELASILERQDVSPDQLRQAAASLRQSGNAASARALLKRLTLANWTAIISTSQTFSAWLR